MDTNYLEAIAIIQDTRSNLEKVLIKANKEEFENKKGFSCIENFISEIERITDTIDYYSRPIKEGYLIKNPSGQFEIECINKGGNYPLCHGDHIEILISAEGWKTGRVGCTINDKGYYFSNEELEDPELYSGMKARIRVNNQEKKFLNRMYRIK